MRDDSLPFVTVGIPCLDEERFIEKCISDILAQDYPSDHIEIVVADGGSSDGTRTILDRLSADHPQVRWIDNPRRIQAAAMNEIIAIATGDVLVRLDAHCEYSPNYIRSCIEVMAETGADNVGGAQRARATTRFQRALCAALESPLGVGGARYRSTTEEGFVDTIWLGAFKMRVFETAGLFDPGAITNEDAELNQRILADGGKLYLSPKIVAYYYPRDSISSLAKQYYKYGKGRARTLLKHRTFANVRPLIPFFTIVGGAALALSRSRLGAVAAVVYLTATGVEALRVGRREGAAAVPVVWAIFPVLHASHGVGFAAGLIHYLAHPDWTSEPEKLAPISHQQASQRASQHRRRTTVQPSEPASIVR